MLRSCGSVTLHSDFAVCCVGAHQTTMLDYALLNIRLLPDHHIFLARVNSAMYYVSLEQDDIYDLKLSWVGGIQWCSRGRGRIIHFRNYSFLYKNVT